MKKITCDTLYTMKGQTLLEVLLALSIIAIVIGGAGGVITSSLNNAQVTKNKTLSTKYAQEGIEAMRELRNKSYSQFRNYSGTYCLGSMPAALLASSSCTTPNVTSYIRTVLIDQSGCGTNIAKVTVTVSWKDGKCSSANPYCNNASHSTCLSTINPIQAP
jgi:prepilin-type N-terminal cleavage/methylation domain-containing protein